MCNSMSVKAHLMRELRRLMIFLFSSIPIAIIGCRSFELHTVNKELYRIKPSKDKHTFEGFIAYN